MDVNDEHARGAYEVSNVEMIHEAKSASEANKLLHDGWVLLGLAPHTDHAPSIWLGLPKQEKPQVRGPYCLNCEHPQAQHDDGGCLFPKWDKGGGTTCYCAMFQVFRDEDARDDSPLLSEKPQ